MSDPAASASRFGEWSQAHGLPAFAYTADQTALDAASWTRSGFGETRRHWLGVGNQRLQLFVGNDGTAGLFDEHHGLRWLTGFDPDGTGVSRVATADGPAWGTRFADWPPGAAPTRTFGPTWFRVEAQADGVRLERTLLCPEGETPWVLVRVAVTASADRDLRLSHTEEWAVRPQFLNVGVAMAVDEKGLGAVQTNAARCVRYDVELAEGAARAVERRTGDAARPLDPQWRALGLEQADAVFGPPVPLLLQALGDTPGRAGSDGAAHPTLSLTTDLALAAGETRVLWFRFGVDDGVPCADPAARYQASLRGLAERLPSAASDHLPMAAREVPWHAALLTGGACVDGVIGGHTLGENSSYALGVGVNGAARDPLQYALPLVYVAPDLALSILRNTLAWAGADGEIPWGLDGAKLPRGLGAAYGRPSDFGLWALWLAAEYAAATGDLAAFARPLAPHPVYRAEPQPLAAHLARQFDNLLTVVGFGPNGHLRMRDCDWADGYLGDADRETMRRDGESVLNSAMAAWVLPVWAALAERLGDAERAGRARAVAAELRDRVAAEWTGRWFRRARCGDLAVGEEMLFLEVQPWAILCGAADPAMAKTLLGEIDRHLRRGSPLGARQRWPLGEKEPFPPGESLSGGVWFALLGPLIWAMAKVDPDMAIDEWCRFSLAGHTAAYPHIWEGTLSGPDAYNASESRRPGRTWGACQAYPVNNPHAHAQPLLAYLRLLGVEPLADGSLQARGGPGSFRSPTFEISARGEGSLAARGEVTIAAAGGPVAGSGRVHWIGGA